MKCVGATPIPPGFFDFEDVSIINSRRQSRSSPPSNGEAEPVGLDQLLQTVPAPIQEVFLALRERILHISDSVWERVNTKTRWCDYRTTSTFAGVQMQQARLRIYLKMGDKPIDDPRHLTEDIPANWGFSHLNKRLDLSGMDDLDYTMQLIKQAHDYVTG